MNTYHAIYNSTELILPAGKLVFQKCFDDYYQIMVVGIFQIIPALIISKGIVELVWSKSTNIKLVGLIEEDIPVKGIGSALVAGTWPLDSSIFFQNNKVFQPDLSDSFSAIKISTQTGEIMVPTTTGAPTFPNS